MNITWPNILIVMLLNSVLIIASIAYALRSDVFDYRQPVVPIRTIDFEEVVLSVFNHAKTSGIPVQPEEIKQELLQMINALAKRGVLVINISSEYNTPEEIKIRYQNGQFVTQLPELQ